VGCPGCRCSSENRPVFFREIDFSAKLRGQHHSLPNLHPLQEFFESSFLVPAGEIPPGFFNDIA
jgi:hypothetical protein